MTEPSTEQAPATPPPPTPSASPKPATTGSASQASSSNVQPGVHLASGERVDDAADVAKRDERVKALAEQYDDPEQKQRVYDRFNDAPEG